LWRAASVDQIAMSDRQSASGHYDATTARARESGDGPLDLCVWSGPPSAEGGPPPILTVACAGYSLEAMAGLIEAARFIRDPEEC
jgi:hypothetical protein